MSGKSREVEKKKHGGFSQKEKRRCHRPESLRMRSKGPTWTLMMKATMDEGKSKITDVKVACSERKAKK